VQYVALNLGDMQPDKVTRTVRRCREIIHRVAGTLVQESKKKVMEGEKEGSAYGGKDLLSLLRMSQLYLPSVVLRIH
jgi:hypothetical protein